MSLCPLTACRGKMWATLLTNVNLFDCVDFENNSKSRISLSSPLRCRQALLLFIPLSETKKFCFHRCISRIVACDRPTLFASMSPTEVADCVLSATVAQHCSGWPSVILSSCIRNMSTSLFLELVFVSGSYGLAPCKLGQLLQLVRVV